MQKLKPLLPTLKEKKRYLVYEVISKSELSKDVSTEVIKKCTELLGIFESSKAGLMNVKYNNEKQRGIIKVSNKYTDKLKTCLMMIKKLNDNEIIIKSIYVSGLLNKAEKYI